MYFNLSEVLGEQMLLNFCTSSRGAGKTFSTLKKCVEDFLNTGEQFVYVRRTQSELDTSAPTLLTAFKPAGFFLEHSFNFKKDCFLIDGKVMGYAVAVSTAHKLKSTSFPLVTKIIFDEFISESGSYLKDEVTKFLSLIETVGRMRDITVVCLANKSTIYNPYYLYFDVRPSKSEKTRFRKKSILIYDFKSVEYKERKKETEFGKLIKDTPYGGFMLDNDNILDDYTFVDKLKGVQKTPLMGLTAQATDICVYDYEKEGLTHLHFSIKKPFSDKPCFNLDKTLKENRSIESARTNPYLKRIKLYFNKGLITFDSVQTKNIISSIIF